MPNVDALKARIKILRQEANNLKASAYQLKDEAFANMNCLEEQPNELDVKAQQLKNKAFELQGLAAEFDPNHNEGKYVKAVQDYAHELQTIAGIFEKDANELKIAKRIIDNIKELVKSIELIDAEKCKEIEALLSHDRSIIDKIYQSDPDLSVGLQNLLKHCGLQD
ncbi:MAG: hypothetical protein QNJ51_02460 [Calothrix sp. MO_167.B12]|nr:hypothetical protein [Calothrix sp. MO_167.B12]